MVDGCCYTGSDARLAIDGTRLEFLQFIPTRVMKTLTDGSDNAIRADLDHDPNLVAPGMEYDEFQIRLYMTAQNMNVLLPLMGFSQVSTTWTQGTGLSSKQVILGSRTSGIPEAVWANSFCAKWVAHGQKGGDPPRLDLWFRAYARTEQTAGTFFTSDTDPATLTEYAYAFNGGTVFTFDGQAYAINQYQIGCDYGLVAEWMNSVTATNICPTDHNIGIGAGMLYAPCASTVTNLMTTPFSGDVTGGAFSLAFSRTIGLTTYSTTINIANVKQIAMQPPILSKHDFVRLPFNGRGYRNGTTAALIIDNNP